MSIQRGRVQNGGKEWGQWVTDKYLKIKTEVKNRQHRSQTKVRRTTTILKNLYTNLLKLSSILRGSNKNLIQKQG